MKLEQSFEVAAPLEQVWRTLIDVEHVAPCLPGAAVTGRNDDGSYNGTFTVKIGPTTASYTGKLEMENIDEASHTATMQAQGTDKRGQGGAKATIMSRLAPADGHGTRVEVVTDYHITGRLARFGRGGMIEDISERLLREFAKRLQSSLAAAPAVAEVAVPVADVAVPAAEASAPEPAAAEHVAHEHAPHEHAAHEHAAHDEHVAHGHREHEHAAHEAAETSPPEPPRSADTVVSPAPEMPPAPEEPPAHEEPPAEAVAEAPTEVMRPYEASPSPTTAHGFSVPPSPTTAHGFSAPPSPAAPHEEPAPGAGHEQPAPAAAAPATPEPPPHAPPPPPPAPAPLVSPPPPPTAAQPPLQNPPMPTEPMQGLSLMGSVVWGRIKRNPAPAAAAGVAVVLLVARRRRRRR
jgi:carbon monoxide dehydrogenase subunit G